MKPNVSLSEMAVGDGSLIPAKLTLILRLKPQSFDWKPLILLNPGQIGPQM